MTQPTDNVRPMRLRAPGPANSDAPLVFASSPDQTAELWLTEHLAAKNRMLVLYQNEFHQFTGQRYVRRSDEYVKGELRHWLRGAVTETGEGDNKKPVPFNPTRNKVDEVLAALRSIVPEPLTAPTWLEQPEGDVPADHNLVATPSALLDLTHLADDGGPPATVTKLNGEAITCTVNLTASEVTDLEVMIPALKGRPAPYHFERCLLELMRHHFQGGSIGAKARIALGNIAFVNRTAPAAGIDISVREIGHTPAYFNTHLLGADCAEGGPSGGDCAPHFSKFLADLFSADIQAMCTLQEWFGYCLVREMKLHKALMLIGPPRAGKGTIFKLLRWLLGGESVLFTQLEELSGAHGLEGWPGKRLVVFPDERLSGKVDQNILTGRLLKIIGGDDSLRVNPKGVKAFDWHPECRIMLGTNLGVAVHDASGAFANRWIVLELTESFLGREDPDLDEKLRSELPQILHWSLEGLRRLRRRGKFIQPESGKAALAEMECVGNPVGAFVEERCTLGPGLTEQTQKLYEAFRVWATERGYHHIPNAAHFGRDLRAAHPKQFARKLSGPKQAQQWHYSGIALGRIVNAPTDDADNVTSLRRRSARSEGH